MTDTSTYRSTLRRRSVSESDTDLLNSMSIRGEILANIFPLTDPAKSSPNISVSGSNDKSPFNGPGTCLQLKREGMETRIMERFQRIKLFPRLRLINSLVPF